MRSIDRRLAGLTLACSVAALLVLGAAANVTARPSGPSAGRTAGFVSVTVLSATGGGKDRDVRKIGSISLEGGIQTFAASAKIVDPRSVTPVASWSVKPSTGTGASATITQSPLSSSYRYTGMKLPAGKYDVWSNTVNCTWSIVITESRPVVTITSFTPASGPVGTHVTLVGTGFTNARTVTFGGPHLAVFTVVSPTEIAATVPADAVSGPISVFSSDYGRNGTSSQSFTVIPGPTIANFSPTSGAAGTQVIIQGTGLGSASSVSFNGAAATIVNGTSTTQITAVVPPAATSGPITVTTPGGSVTSSTRFSVQPAITGFTPASGPTGTVVTVTGTGLGNVSAVKFNGTAATISSNSATQIVTTVPAGATTGPISVTGPDGDASSAGSFAVVPATTISLSLTGLRGGALKLGKNVTASGTVTPVGVPGGQVKLTVQKKTSGSWAQVASGFASLSAGRFRWQYRPARRGTYRMQASVAATATSLAASSDWAQFAVR